ncbi:transcription-associated protein 1, partial [Coemansia guatemalensis]
MAKSAGEIHSSQDGVKSASGAVSSEDGGAGSASGAVASVEASSSAMPDGDASTSMQVDKSPSSPGKGSSNAGASHESDGPQQTSASDPKQTSPGGVSTSDAAAAASVEADVVDTSAAGSVLGNPPASEPANGPSASAASLKKTQLAFQRLTARLSPENGRLLRSFLALITKELANPSTAVRETVKACLGILAEVTGCSTTALLLPSRDRLLVPIFSKPLRALPHNMQIGNIDAITYCLSLDPPFLDINEELLRLLSEALALADAEDQALVNHPAQVHSNTASLTHLRHVCIRMLTAAMVRPEFADAKNTPTRARIISVFFKSLYHKSVEVVDAANDGLKQVLLQQQKLPRDLLQTGLRPILINLSDYKRLTVASLDGLARLLQLLTNYFKVEVGRKLLDHMQQWANPQLLQSAAERPIEDMHEIKILVAILQVFHLLPPSASVLLDDLVSSVVNLEVHLCRRESSPFRTPLFKFLNRYPTESVVYFVERIESVHYARIFCHAIVSPQCGPLRDALVAQTPLLVSLLKGFCAAATASKSDSAAGHADAAASSADLTA